MHDDGCAVVVVALDYNNKQQTAEEHKLTTIRDHTVLLSLS